MDSLSKILARVLPDCNKDPECAIADNVGLEVRVESGGIWGRHLWFIAKFSSLRQSIAHLVGRGRHGAGNWINSLDSFFRAYWDLSGEGGISIWWLTLLLPWQITGGKSTVSNWIRKAIGRMCFYAQVRKYFIILECFRQNHFWKFKFCNVGLHTVLRFESHWGFLLIFHYALLRLELPETFSIFKIHFELIFIQNLTFQISGINALTLI